MTDEQKQTIKNRVMRIIKNPPTYNGRIETLEDYWEQMDDFMIDVNIYRSEETNEIRATAYPLYKLKNGTVETDTGTYVEIL